MVMQNPDFYNYSRLGEVRNPANENPPFIWPGVNIRNISNDGVSVRMARGFMRSILTDPEIVSAFNNPTEARQTTINNNPGHYRLNFQFNPEYIERSVAQTPGAVNPILQSVSNLTQPIPGSATFNFTMTFNRELEVAAAGNRADSDLLWEGNDIDPDSTRLKDPGLVGVWADLQMFDLIVGQGITPQLLDLVSAYTEVQAIERSANESTTTDGEEEEEPKDGENKDGTAQTDPDAITFDKDEFTKNFTANFGNSAFLNPLPVRIVFSDTFMVEGMVTGTSVAFQKFNHRMIPTICQINVNFSAMYLGFAKKNAFLTDNLKAWAKDEAAAATDEQEKTEEVGKKLADGIGKVTLWPNVVLKDKKFAWSGKNDPPYVGNEDQFLMHSSANANPSGTVIYETNFMWLGHYYNIVNTKLYKNGLDITLSAKILYTSSLPIGISIEYLMADTALRKPNFDVKIDLVHKYTNPETGLKSNEIIAPCTVSSISPEWDFSNWVNTGNGPRYDARRDFYVTLGKLPGIPKVNSKLSGTENLTQGDYKNLTLRITVTPTITTEVDGTSITASQPTNPIDFTSVFWDSRHDVQGARTLHKSEALAKIVSDKPIPPTAIIRKT